VPDRIRPSRGLWLGGALLLAAMILASFLSGYLASKRSNADAEHRHTREAAELCRSRQGVVDALNGWAQRVNDNSASERASWHIAADTRRRTDPGVGTAYDENASRIKDLPPIPALHC
jgi:hypothetical protein